MNVVEAVLFDLDNTLLGTSKLEQARTTGDRKLFEKLLPQIKLFKKTLNVLEDIKTKGFPMGLVTNSPRWYAERLLSHFDIESFFEVVICYDDVRASGAKPNAFGINLACDRLGVKNKNNVFYIGDQKIDIDASYAAGVVPLAPTWANIKIAQMPVCVVSTSEFVEQLHTPSNLRLLAEAAADNENLTAIEGKNFYFVPLNLEGEVVFPGRENLDILTFGRYFTNKSEITSTLRASHKLSKEISQKDLKENQTSFEVPEYWIDLVLFILQRIGKFVYRGDGDFDIVTVIPSKQGKPPRLETLLAKVADGTKNLPYEFIPDLFYFTEGARSLKTLGGSHARNQEIERTLKLNDKYAQAIKGKRVIVIDDVITTGATVKKAKRILEEHDVERFLGVAIAKTVHAIGPQKDCSECGRPMGVREGTYNIPFWGCSGFHEKIDPCRHTAKVEVKECPACENKLVKKNGKFGFYLSHDAALHGRDCNYTESF